MKSMKSKIESKNAEDSKNTGADSMNNENNFVRLENNNYSIIYNIENNRQIAPQASRISKLPHTGWF